MSLADWHRHYGELQRLLAAYAGEEPDDALGSPSRALNAYLRQTSPTAATTAAEQIRGLLAAGINGSGIDRIMPIVYGTGPEQWLSVVAALLDAAVDDGFPAPGDPVTHWEWNTRFPELGQLLGCYFNQDFPDEFALHDAALDAWLSSTDRHARARVTGEIHELLVLGIETPALVDGLGELGMEVDPPTAPEDWLAYIANRAAAPR